MLCPQEHREVASLAPQGSVFWVKQAQEPSSCWRHILWILDTHILAAVPHQPAGYTCGASLSCPGGRAVDRVHSDPLPSEDQRGREAAWILWGAGHPTMGCWILEAVRNSHSRECKLLFFLLFFHFQKRIKGKSVFSKYYLEGLHFRLLVICCRLRQKRHLWKELRILRISEFWLDVTACHMCDLFPDPIFKSRDCVLLVTVFLIPSVIPGQIRYSTNICKKNDWSFI